MIKRTVFSLAVVCASLLVVGCPAGGGGGMFFLPPGGGGSGGPPLITPSEYQISGTVVGLGTGDTVTLQLNDDSTTNLVVDANTGFLFTKPIEQGASFKVEAVSATGGKKCMAFNSHGTVAGSSVTGVKVVCSDIEHALSVRVTGLESGSMVVENNAVDELSVTNNLAIEFPKKVPSGAEYYVVVEEQPDNQVCNAKGSNAGTMGGAVTVEIECGSSSHRISGTYSGLAGNGLQVRLNNTGEVITLNSDDGQSGSFNFAQEVVDGTHYSVEIIQQPGNQNQRCSIKKGNGKAEADVVDVSISCETKSFTLSGWIVGLNEGEQAVLRLNGGNEQVVTSAKTTFSWRLNSGEAYNVSVSSPPAGKTCSGAAGTGIMGSADKNVVAIFCDSDPLVKGNVSGLCPGQRIRIQANYSSTIDVTGDYPFFFVPDANLLLTVQASPPGVVCEGITVPSGATNAIIKCTGCGSCQGEKAMTVAWTPSRSYEVNDASGGGHKVYYRPSGVAEADAMIIDVPNTQSKNSVTIPGLGSCSYYVKVKGYSAINPGGGSLSTQKSITIP